MRSFVLLFCLFLVSCSSELAVAPDTETVSVVESDRVIVIDIDNKTDSKTDNTSNSVDAGSELTDAGTEETELPDAGTEVEEETSDAGELDTEDTEDTDSDSEDCTEHDFRPHPHEDEVNHSYHHREKCRD